MAIMERVKHAWNAFMNKDPTSFRYYNGYASSYKPDRFYLTGGLIKSVVGPIYNRISVDASGIDIKHVRLDEEDKFKEIIKDSLNYALSKSANIDQTGRVMMREAILSMLDEGVVAIVPVLTDGDPNETDSFKVEELRVGKIVEWFPKDVRVDMYNDATGNHDQVIVGKRYTVIVENPFYEIMNEPNSTMQRLMKVLKQLDSINDQASSGKIDLIIQLPYAVKSPAKQKIARERRNEVEAQMTNSQYGIAYIDGTEKVIQLNRSLENNLWEQAKELQEQVYAQLGLSKAVFDGTADEKTMLNYSNQTLEPILTAFTEEMERKWISKTARTQGQAVKFFRDPFKLVPVGQIAEIADKFTRNEIMTSNEMRGVIGMRPSNDPKADELINSNLNQSDDEKMRYGLTGATNKKADVQKIINRISK